MPNSDYLGGIWSPAEETSVENLDSSKKSGGYLQILWWVRCRPLNILEVRQSKQKLEEHLCFPLSLGAFVKIPFLQDLYSDIKLKTQPASFPSERMSSSKLSHGSPSHRCCIGTRALSTPVCLSGRLPRISAFLSVVCPMCGIQNFCVTSI